MNYCNLAGMTEQYRNNYSRLEISDIDIARHYCISFWNQDTGYQDWKSAIYFWVERPN